MRLGSGPGRRLQVNGDFAGLGDGAIGWHLTPGAASPRHGISGSELTLSSGGGSETSAVFLLPGKPQCSEKGGGWQTLAVGIVCPPGTDQIRIDLRNAGIGDLDLRGVHLYEVLP